MENETSELKIGDRLALTRTALAQERTLMASARTSISLVSFGFTISKFFQQLREHNVVGGTGLASRRVGLWLIGIGTAYMLFSCIQHISVRNQLKNEGANPRTSFSFFLGMLIVLLGIALIVSYYINFLQLDLN